MIHWYKKGLFKKYPSTLYISINKVKYFEVDVVSEHNRQELIPIDSSSSQSEINSDSINYCQETYQVKIMN